MTLSANLRRILKEKGITQRQFADMVGKEEAYVSRVMSGKYNISLETITQFAEALNIDPSSLLKLENDEIIASALRDLPDDLKEFIKYRPNITWIYLARDLQKSDLEPDNIRSLVQLWKNTVERGGN